jgi:hypothetical protein
MRQLSGPIETEEKWVRGEIESPWNTDLNQLRLNLAKIDKKSETPLAPIA